MTHTNQVQNFRHFAFPFSGGFSSFLFRRKFRGIDLAGLYELLSSELLRTNKFAVAASYFTLVNVTSTFNKFSRGSSGTPPEDTWPSRHHLLFTFSFSPLEYTELLGTPLVINKVSSTKSYFGELGNVSAFVTVGISAGQAETFGLSGVFSDSLFYLFNTLGPLTKNLAQNRKTSSTLVEDYSSLHGNIVLDQLFSRYFNKPLSSLLDRIPYPYWVFNRYVWTQAPNLISEKHLTPEAVMFYFLHVHDELVSTSNPANDRLTELLGTGTSPREKSIVGVLADSIELFLQRVPATTYLGYLAPSVIESVLFSGSARIRADNNTGLLLRQLSDSASAVSETFSSRPAELAPLFTPPEKAAKKLMVADSAYTAALQRELQRLTYDL